MAQGPILSASASTSRDVMDKHSLRPPINGKIYNMAMPNLCFSEGNGSSSENMTKGESSQSEITEVSDNANTNETEESDSEIETVLVDQEETPLIPTPVPELQSGSNNTKIEIARSIVYGGLTELIASLGIVTSAAATTTKTSKIVGFSLATVITGLFIMTYKISELWMNNQKPNEDEAEPEDIEESYENVFGDRRNYHLHFTVAMISYSAFGLVPPLVYGFTFRKREDMLLKIPTVTIVTTFCTALLGVCKAYIKRASNCVEYVNIIGKCIFYPIGTSMATTVGGILIVSYIEKNGWFEPNQMSILFQPAMSFENATWGAYY